MPEHEKLATVTISSLYRDQRYPFVRRTPEAARAVVVHTGEPGGLPEYVVATGESWFYKAALPSGAECLFHAWPKARQAGVAANQPHVGQSATSFTQSGESRHCAHEELRGMRSPRCHVAVVETHLCCRACIFNSICWARRLGSTAMPRIAIKTRPEIGCRCRDVGLTEIAARGCLGRLLLTLLTHIQKKKFDLHFAENHPSNAPAAR